MPPTLFSLSAKPTSIEVVAPSGRATILDAPV